MLAPLLLFLPTLDVVLLLSGEDLLLKIHALKYVHLKVLVVNQGVLKWVKAERVKFCSYLQEIVPVGQELWKMEPKYIMDSLIFGHQELSEVCLRCPGRGGLVSGVM